MRLRILFTLILSLITGSAMANHEKTIYGYVEKLTLLGKNLTLSAKLDTGAKSASLNAAEIQEIDVKGVPYLRFKVPSPKGDFIFECEYIGKVKIKSRAGEMQSGQSKTAMRRPMVLMYMQLGDKVRAIQVNLTNRKRFIYPLLLGRDAIKDFEGIVDPSIVFAATSLNPVKHEKK